jgi:two-component system sensor histidine kinase YesM
LLFGKFKLKHQIFFLISVSAVLLIAIQAFYWGSFYRLTESRAASYQQKLINQTYVKIESVLQDIRTNTDLISQDRSMQEFLSAEDLYNRNIVYGQFILDLLDYVKSFNSILYGIQIEEDNRTINSLSASDSSFFYTGEYKEFITGYKEKYGKSKKSIFTSAVKDPYTGKQFFFYLSPILNLQGGEDFAEIMGYCSIMINTSNFQELIQNTELTLHSDFMILDKENRIIASNKKEKQGTIFGDFPEIVPEVGTGGVMEYNGRKVLVQKRNLEMTEGWKIVSIIPVNELTTDMGFILQVGIFSVAGMIAILLALGIMIFKNITQPVTGLVADMKKIGERKIDSRLKVRSTNEVGVLAGEINAMMDRIEGMTRNIFNNQARMYELELMKKKAEFSTLQSQINPHFLYNTLNCISSIGLAYGSKEIAQICYSMSMIFRYSIQSTDLVSISEEIESINAYLNIINIRYNGKYAMKVDMEEGILERKTPKMLLQPIIENAVYHGLENAQHGGGVTVRGYLDENGDVCFAVIDTGTGIEEKRLEDIRSKLKMEYSERIKSTDASVSIGIVNINNRIKLLFGDQYGVEIESRLGDGTTVVIKIPGLKDAAA